MKRYENKVALVTGGNSGIGVAAARQLVLEGARVAITGRDNATLDAVAKELGVLAIRADVASLDDLDRVYAEVSRKLGKVDFLFANAGIYKGMPLADTTEAFYDEQFDINVKGLFFTVQKALPHLNDGAAIVLNSSVVNAKGWPGISVYSAAKAAVRSFARTFSAELLPRGIRVNAVSPGATFTPIFGRLGLNEAELKVTVEGMLAGIPMKRFATAEEIAEAALFLGSAQAGYIVGAELTVDGGLGQL
ncbi:MAG: SDR family oxidoreductase [Betaproteobacteria bacterium]|nr:SDR family oxidoreductase [Betaproteobacteria bacterium]